MLAESQANGENVDPEAMLSQEELLMMVGEASMVIDQLEQQEEELVRFKMGQTKSIKCPFCQHVGRSVMEESNPPIAYVLCVVLLLLFGYLGVILFPCLLGVFRS